MRSAGNSANREKGNGVVQGSSTSSTNWAHEGKPKREWYKLVTEYGKLKKSFYLRSRYGCAFTAEGDKIDNVFRQRIHEKLHEEKKIAMIIFFGRDLFRKPATGVRWIVLNCK